MTTTFKKTFGSNTFDYFYNPGRSLDDLSLMNLYNDLDSINQNSKRSLDHGLLPKVSTVSNIRDLYDSALVCIIRVEGRLSGFLITPIINRHGLTVVHGGLVMINRNKGHSLLAFASTHTALFLHRKLGSYITTNISSTPSIIEVFTNIVSKPWPSPQASLVRPYKNYKLACQALYEGYMKKAFLSPEDLEIDYRRFVVRSKSQKMGFVADLRQISRSKDFKFMNFCFTWLDYQKEEDMVQVGMVKRITTMKLRLHLIMIKVMFYLNSRKSENIQKQKTRDVVGQTNDHAHENFKQAG